jgi:hypothetical protein
LAILFVAAEMSVIGFAANQGWQWRSSHTRDAAFAFRAMTKGAFFRVDAGALGGRSRARRQTDAVGLDADVPSGDAGFVQWLAEMR